MFWWCQGTLGKVVIRTSQHAGVFFSVDALCFLHFFFYISYRIDESCDSCQWHHHISEQVKIIISFPRRNFARASTTSFAWVCFQVCLTSGGCFWDVPWLDPATYYRLCTYTVCIAHFFLFITKKIQTGN